MDIVYSAHETAFILRLALGPIRAWADSLNDMRRGRASVNGFVLKPIVKLHLGGAWRPVYQHEDIWAFIENVRAVDPTAREGIPPRYKGVKVDPLDKKYGVVRKVPVFTVWPEAA